MLHAIAVVLLPIDIPEPPRVFTFKKEVGSSVFIFIKCDRYANELNKIVYTKTVQTELTFV